MTAHPASAARRNRECYCSPQTRVAVGAVGACVVKDEALAQQTNP
jgi:hypothetical protein